MNRLKISAARLLLLLYYTEYPLSDTLVLFLVLSKLLDKDPLLRNSRSELKTSTHLSSVAPEEVV